MHSLPARVRGLAGKVLAGRLTGQSLVVLPLRLGALALTFAFMKTVTSLTGAEGWGQFSICYTVAILLVALSRLGADTALLRFTATSVAWGQYHRLGSVVGQVVRLSGPVSLVLAAGLWWAAPWLSGTFFEQPALFYYLRIVALWVPLWTMLFIATECLRGFGRVSGFVALQQVFPVALALAALVPALTGHLPVFAPDVPLVTYGMGLLLSATVAWAWVGGLLVSTRRGTGAGAGRFPFRKLYMTALPMLSTSVLAIVLGWADTLLLGRMAPPAETGQYAAALRVSFLTLLPLQVISSVLAPQVAAAHERGGAVGLAAATHRATRLIRWATLPAYAVIAIGAPWIMGFLGRDMGPATPILIVLATGQLLNAMAGPLDVVLQMTGHERLYRNLIALGTGLNIVLNLLLIPVLGGMGAAVASVLTILSWNVAGLYVVRRRLGFWM